MTETEIIIAAALQRAVLPLNPEAAFEKAATPLELLPASPETDVTVAGVAYRAQAYRTIRDRSLQHIIYAPVGQWDAAAWFEYPNNPAEQPQPEPEPEPLTGYFVDPAGDDSADGRTRETAWRTLARAGRAPEGAALYLRAGGEWTGTLLPKDGMSVGAYGEGALPIIRLSGGKRGIDARGRSGVTVRDVAVYGPEYGIDMAGGNSAAVLGCQFDECGTGVNLAGFGSGAEVAACRFGHNYETMPNAYGGVAVLVDGADIEVHHNVARDQATAFVELYVNGGANRCERVHIHHNDCQGTHGFIEMASPSISRTVSDVTLAYNRVVDTPIFISMHNVAHQTSGEGATFSGIRAYNNSYVNALPYGVRQAWVCYIPGDPRPGELELVNNLFVVRDYWHILDDARNWANLRHEGNVYWRLSSGTNRGVTLSPSERDADPLVANLEDGNLHPTAVSPLHGAGVALGYTEDLDGVQVGQPPTVGCYEASA